MTFHAEASGTNDITMTVLRLSWVNDQGERMYRVSIDDPEDDEGGGVIELSESALELWCRAFLGDEKCLCERLTGDFVRIDGSHSDTYLDRSKCPVHR